MKTIINIRNVKQTLQLLNKIKNKKFRSIDIEIINVHLLSINDLARKKIFKNNTLYVNSDTLYELMLPIGVKGSHNSHELVPDDILMMLTNFDNPYCVLEGKNKRYMIVSTKLSHFNEPLMTIIETSTGIIQNPKVKVNKIITIYPKREIEKLIQSLKPDKVIYIKK